MPIRQSLKPGKCIVVNASLANDQDQNLTSVSVDQRMGPSSGVTSEMSQGNSEIVAQGVTNLVAEESPSVGAALTTAFLQLLTSTMVPGIEETDTGSTSSLETTSEPESSHYPSTTEKSDFNSPTSSGSSSTEDLGFYSTSTLPPTSATQEPGFYSTPSRVGLGFYSTSFSTLYTTERPGFYSTPSTTDEDEEGKSSHSSRFPATDETSTYLSTKAEDDLSKVTAMRRRRPVEKQVKRKKLHKNQTILKKLYSTHAKLDTTTSPVLDQPELLAAADTQKKYENCTPSSMTKDVNGTSDQDVDGSGFGHPEHNKMAVKVKLLIERILDMNFKNGQSGHYEIPLDAIERKVEFDAPDNFADIPYVTNETVKEGWKKFIDDLATNFAFVRQQALRNVKETSLSERDFNNEHYVPLPGRRKSKDHQTIDPGDYANLSPPCHDDCEKKSDLPVTTTISDLPTSTDLYATFHTKSAATLFPDKIKERGRGKQRTTARPKFQPPKVFYAEATSFPNGMEQENYRKQRTKLQPSGAFYAAAASSPNGMEQDDSINQQDVSHTQFQPPKVLFAGSTSFPNGMEKNYAKQRAVARPTFQRPKVFFPGVTSLPKETEEGDYDTVPEDSYANIQRPKVFYTGPHSFLDEMEEGDYEDKPEQEEVEKQILPLGDYYSNPWQQPVSYGYQVLAPRPANIENTSRLIKKLNAFLDKVERLEE